MSSAERAKRETGIKMETNKVDYKTFPWFWSPDVNLMNKVYGVGWEQELNGDITPDSMEYNKLIMVEKDNLFHISSYSNQEPIETIKCTLCGGNEFNVGKDTFFTAIKCVECGYEVCIHEG